MDSKPVNASNVQKSVNGSQRRSVAGAKAELRYHAKRTAMLGHYCFEPGPAHGHTGVLCRNVHVISHENGTGFQVFALSRFVRVILHAVAMNTILTDMSTIVNSSYSSLAI